MEERKGGGATAGTGLQGVQAQSSGASQCMPALCVVFPAVNQIEVLQVAWEGWILPFNYTPHTCES